jgi:Fur family zinc uptake transcriptional regulator
MLVHPHNLPRLTPRTAVRAAELLCSGRGARLTALRSAVLEALWDAGQPQSAYSLLAQVQIKLGRELKPPTIYRALEFLLAHRLIGRIESRSAYVPCAHPGRQHGCVFLVCDQCNTSVEVEDPQLETLIEKDAQTLGFHMTHRVVELQGVCAACSSAPVGPTESLEA